VKRIGILCLVVAVLLACVAVCTRTAEAQRHQGTSQAVPQPSGYYPAGLTPTPQQQASVPVQEAAGFEPRKADTVEELLSKLDAIKAKKAELEKVEKETVAMLKEKLKEQKQRLQNLGVPGDESTEPPTNSTAPQRIPFGPTPGR
jgi:hypothetical protein